MVAFVVSQKVTPPGRAPRSIPATLHCTARGINKEVGAFFKNTMLPVHYELGNSYSRTF